MIKKKISILIIIIVLLCLSYYFANNYSKTIDFIDNNYSSFLLDDFGEYESLKCFETRTGTILFPAYTDNVIVSYNSNEYYIQLLGIEKKYSYLNDAVLSKSKDEYLIASPNFIIGNWNFRVIDNHSYPNYIELIATNDSEYKIAYMTFVDSELDTMCSISENNQDDYMQKFIKKYFKFKFEEAYK